MVRRVLAGRALLLLSFMILGSFVQAEGRQTFGYVEKAKFFPGDLTFHAKLDTGADTCSLDARDITEYENNGRKWVSFKVSDSYGKEFTVKRELIRNMRVKRVGAPGQVRKVIRAGICLGNTYVVTDVTLIDRHDFNYQLLLGRNFLASFALINPAITFATEPNCKVSDLK